MYPYLIVFVNLGEVAIPFNSSRSSSITRIGNLSGIVALLRVRLSTRNLQLPSFFFTKITSLEYGLLLGLIIHVHNRRVF